MLNGTGNDDVMFGEAGDDTVFGHAGNDRLNGGQGVDTLHGGDGDDRLSGYNFQGIGPEALFGDAGADVFAFQNHATTLTRGLIPSVGAEIRDFETARDKIELLFTGTAGDGSVTWLDALPFTGRSRLEVRLVGGRLEIDADGDRVPEIQLQITGAIRANDISVEYDPWGY